MPDTTGRIRAKALDQTGMTEALLEQDWGTGAGRVRLALVELRTVEPHGPNLDGKRRIDYVMELIEPVPEAQEAVVRDLMSAVYRSRPEVEGQAVLAGTNDAGPTIDQAADAVGAQVERDEHGHVKGVWNGDLDAPLEAPEPETAAAPAGDEVSKKRATRKKAEPKPDPCDYPTCDLPAEHDGDHPAPGID